MSDLTEVEILKRNGLIPCHATNYNGIQEKIFCGQQYAKAAVLGVRPLPCVRDEHGEIQEQTVKQLFAKIDEELNEFKAEVSQCHEDTADCAAWLIKRGAGEWREGIAEEAADTITAITTMLEALGIDAEMRDYAQRMVNAKNRERKRL